MIIPSWQTILIAAKLAYPPRWWGIIKWNLAYVTSVFNREENLRRNWNRPPVIIRNYVDDGHGTFWFKPTAATNTERDIRLLWVLRTQGNTYVIAFHIWMVHVINNKTQIPFINWLSSGNGRVVLRGQFKRLVGWTFCYKSFPFCRSATTEPHWFIGAEGLPISVFKIKSIIRGVLLNRVFGSQHGETEGRILSIGWIVKFIDPINRYQHLNGNGRSELTNQELIACLMDQPNV